MRSIARAPVVCGVDIGTTNIKVVAVDASGSVVARASRPTPRDAEGLWIDARTLLAAIEEMLVQACGDRFEVHAICAAGVGEDGVLVDAELHPLTAALGWFDPRRQSIFRDLRPSLGDDETFDTESDPGRSIVGWKWASDQVPVGRAARWIALGDFASVAWTGTPFLSDTLASRTGAWRSADRSWAADRVRLTLGSLELLPPVVRSGDVIGRVDSTRLREAGIIADDAVSVAGGHDHPIGGWGIHQLAPGAILDSMGTAEVVVTQSPTADFSRRDHVDVAPGIRSSSTTLLRVEELARNVEWASQDPEVARFIRGVLDGTFAPEPVLDDTYFNPGARGGGRPFYSLDAPSDPRARASAVLGALAHLGREAIEAVRGGTVDGGDVRLAGGWVRSPGWVDIKAAVNGYRTITIREPEVTAVGAALLAAQARGWQIDPVAAFAGPAH